MQGSLCARNRYLRPRRLTGPGDLMLPSIRLRRAHHVHATSNARALGMTGRSQPSSWRLTGPQQERSTAPLRPGRHWRLGVGTSRLHACCTETKSRRDLRAFPLVRAAFVSGANGIRTRGLFHAMEARYQLRHSPSAAEATRGTVPHGTGRMRTQRPGRSPARRPGEGPSSSASTGADSMPSRLIRGQSRQSRSSAYSCLSSVCWT
jgi:hypothetical protein